ncbi:MAG: hypothetical protein BGO41_08805 [Clostridiales bacterium 38-18]|nr:MAG: hypothetical protein BGO41_08805 [Clostridiales bacterium 38-18]
MNFIIIYGLAIVLGVLVTIVPILNGHNTLKFGSLKVSWFHFAAALVVGLFALVIFGGQSEIQSLFSKPIWYYSGGILGTLVIICMNYYAVRITAFHIAVLPFLGQMSMGLILDYIIYNQFEFKTLIGLLIVLFGLTLQLSSTTVLTNGLQNKKDQLSTDL